MRAVRTLVVVALLAMAAASGYRYGVRTAGTSAQPVAPPLESLERRVTAESVALDAAASPPRTIADVLALPTDFSESAALYALAARSDEAALRELISEAERIPHRGDRAGSLSILFSRYGELDPRAALRHLDETGIEPKANLLFMIFNSWAKVDLDAAVAAAHERTLPAERQVANDAILRAYAEADSAVQRDLAARLSSPSGSTPYSPDALVNLAGSDAETALEHALALPAGVAVQVVAAIGGRWATRDPEAAYAYSGRIPDPALRRWFKRGVLFQWAQGDPERVMQLLDESVSREEQEDVINSALTGIMMHDPETALRFAQGIRDDGVRDAAFRLVAQTWAPEDPSAAAAAVVATPDGTARMRLAELVVPSLLRQWSPERTLEWAAEMDDSSGRVTTAAFRAIAQQDAPRAFALAAATPSTELRTRALMLVIGEMTAADPQEAVHYLQQLPTDDVRTAAASQIAGQWAPRDAPAAERWVLGLPPGPMQDSALGALLSSTPIAPNSAVRLISLMQQQGTRTQAAFAQVRLMLQQGNRDGAEALWERVTLEPEYRQQLRQVIDNWPTSRP